ncbi:uncharacterized protein LOC143917891 [Arctopsyche grandis]|uniref:uncharacterized protein LOC143917891 n=1 Tax=Arctopsyche grandis TaxID=121162 RepID=UPI00406D8912
MYIRVCRAFHTSAVSLSRKELFNVWSEEKTRSAKNSAVFSYVCERLGLDRKITNFNSNVSQRWTKSHRVIKYILARESKWLDQNITFYPQHQSTKTLPVPSRKKIG